MKKLLFLLILSSLILSACTPLLGAACPVSQPDDLSFVPLDPMPAEPPYEDLFWHGTDNLWTMLPKSGYWEDLPLSDHGYGQKLWWWAPGFDFTEDPNPIFELLAKPLGRLGEQFRYEQAIDSNMGELGSAILIGVNFPYEGCWEITGNYGEESLSYVVEIVP